MWKSKKGMSLWHKVASWALSHTHGHDLSHKGEVAFEANFKVGKKVYAGFRCVK